jgi:hypothetical protein
MSQHLWRGILVVVLAIGAATAFVALRLGQLRLNRRGDRSRDTRVPPDGEAFEGSQHARQAPLARVMAAALAMLLTAAACSGEPGTSFRSPTLQPSNATPSPTVASSGPSPSNAAGYPNLSRFTDPFDRFAYKSAYSDCRFIGLDGAAEAFGGDPDDPRSVARAYAVATFPQSVEHREATSQGCLDAFETGAP